MKKLKNLQELFDLPEKEKEKFWSKIIKQSNQDQRDLVAKYEHKIGEHGAVGFLTKNGRICSECNQKI